MPSTYQKIRFVSEVMDPDNLPDFQISAACNTWYLSHPRETIYRDNPEGRPCIPLIGKGDMELLRGGYETEWTPAFAKELKAEEGFVPFGAVPQTLSPEEEAVIVRGDKCTRCDGDEYELILCRGVKSPILAFCSSTCPCERVKRFQQRWKELVGVRFQEARLDTLEPLKGLQLSRAGQQHTIATVKANPTHSFFLYGNIGRGKTHLFSALLRAALENEIKQQDRIGNRCRCVFHVTTQTLVTQMNAWQFRGKDDTKIEPPVVDNQKLEESIKAGFRVSLFLDEWDKVVPSANEMLKIGDLINMVYASKGQLVAASNKTPDALIEKWDSHVAGTALRRFGHDPIENLAHMVDFDNPTPFVPDPEPKTEVAVEEIPEETDEINQPDPPVTSAPVSEPVQPLPATKTQQAETPLAPPALQNSTSKGRTVKLRQPKPRRAANKN